MNVPNILELTTAAKRNFLDSFDLIFFDCDGVIWRPVGSIPHTDQAINLLKDAGKSCKFVSNNSVRTDTEYSEKFKKIGIHDVQEQDIIHPAKTMVKYLNSNFPKDARIFSMCSKSANELFLKHGLNIETLHIKEDLTPATYVDKVRLPETKVNVVLFDINLNLSFSEVARACLYLEKYEDCTLIVGAMDKNIPFSADLTTIGLGHLVPLLTEKSKPEPIFLGKPGADLGILLKKIYNITEPKRCLFVGDGLKEDISFGNSCGFQTLLVLTGTATKEAMLNVPVEQRPDFYAEKLVDFVEFFNDLQKQK